MKKSLALLLSVIFLLISLTGCGLTVPRPEIKSGEFDFSVTYEFNGERETVSGVYVCGYNGLAWALDGGYYRVWSGYVKGGEIEDHTLIGTVDGNEIVLVLNFIPDYLMDDYSAELYDAPTPYIMVKMIDEEGLRILQDPDDVEEYCGAKIICYEYDEPIENSFGIFK